MSSTQSTFINATVLIDQWGKEHYQEEFSRENTYMEELFKSAILFTSKAKG